MLWKEGFLQVRNTVGIFILFGWETGEGCLSGPSLRTGKNHEYRLKNIRVAKHTSVFLKDEKGSR